MRALLAAILAAIAMAADAPRVVLQLGHPGSPARVCFSPDGRWLATWNQGGYSGMVPNFARVWTADGRVLASWSGAVDAPRFLADGLLAVPRLAACEVRALGDGSLRASLPAGGGAVALADGRGLVGREGEAVVVRDVNGREQRRWPCTLPAKCHLRAIAGGDLLLAAPGVLVRQAADGTLRWRRELAGAAPDPGRLAVGGNTVAVAWSASGGSQGLDEIRLLDAASGADVITIKTLPISPARAVEMRQPVGEELEISSVAVSLDGGTVAVGFWGGAVALFRRDGTLLRRWDLVDHGYVLDLAFSPDGQRLATAALAGHVECWSVDGQLLWQMPRHRLGGTTFLAFTHDGLAILHGDSKGSLRRWGIDGALRVLYVEGRYADASCTCVESPDGSELAVTSGSDHLRFTRDGRPLPWQDNSWAAPSNPCNALREPADGRMVVVRRSDGAEAGRYRLPDDLLPDALAASPDGRLLVVSDQPTGALVLVNLANGAAVRCLASRRDWVQWSDDGLFDASRDGARLIGIVCGEEVGAPDQHALRLNRPDLILERLGTGAPEDVASLRALVARRERRLGRAPEAGAPAPRVRIVEERRADDVLHLGCRVDGEAFRWQAWVNGVPLNPGGTRLQQGGFSIAVPLLPGANRVEVSATSVAGGESDRLLRIAHAAEAAPGRLWFVGIGVSRYRAAGLDLAYASADVRALAESFARMPGYAGTASLLLVDQEATRTAIRALAERLAGMQAQDTLVLFLAGHGVQSSGPDPTYCFLTHDADPSDPLRTAAPFEDFANLLTAAPARRKLFLIDTCESGAADAAAPSPAGGAGPVARGSRALRPVSGAGRLAGRALFERFVASDLQRSSGATVLSSSLASEASFEDPARGHGLFTAALLEVLADPRSDLDGDRLLSAEELRLGTAARVEAWSGGRQHPTIDHENPYQPCDLPAAAK